MKIKKTITQKELYVLSYALTIYEDDFNITFPHHSKEMKKIIKNIRQFLTYYVENNHNKLK